MRLKIKRLHTDSVIPNYAKQGDCGLDLVASGHWLSMPGKEESESEEFLLEPGSRVLVKTGIAIELPDGTWGNIRTRSGHAAKHGLNVLGGVIDEGYRGEVMVILANQGSDSYNLKKGERVAQLIITPYVCPEVCEVGELSKSERADGRFGHTGK